MKIGIGHERFGNQCPWDVIFFLKNPVAQVNFLTHIHTLKMESRIFFKVTSR